MRLPAVLLIPYGTAGPLSFTLLDWVSHSIATPSAYGLSGALTSSSTATATPSSPSSALTKYRHTLAVRQGHLTAVQRHPYGTARPYSSSLVDWAKCSIATATPYGISDTLTSSNTANPLRNGVASTIYASLTGPNAVSLLLSPKGYAVRV